MRSETNIERSERLGRWAREVVAMLREIWFFFFMMVSNSAKEPLMHATNYLKPKRPTTKQHLQNTRSLLSGMVTEKASEIQQEFTDLLDEKSWPNAIWLWECGLAQVHKANPATSARMWHGHAIIIYVVLSIATEWHQRIMLLMTCYPNMLLWLVAKPFNVPCAKRQQVESAHRYTCYKSINDYVETHNLII